MKRIQTFATSLLCLTATLGAAGAESVYGTVTCEGKPIEGVVVTDGYNCVRTDHTGAYVLELDDLARFIYISTPSGYKVEADRQHPQFYLRTEPGRQMYHFKLTANPADNGRHIMMVQSDVQVVSEDELCMYDLQVADVREHLGQEMNNGTEIFGVDCGDIVGDHPELYQSSLNHRASLGFPMYYVVGNHDMQYYGRTNETSTARYEDTFGPSRYSFNKGNAHYVVLDNCFYIGRDYFYMGYIDEAAFRWLEQDLKNVPAGAPVFVIMHIPTRLHQERDQFTYDAPHVAQSTVNASHLYEMLKPYKANIITGHQHCNFNIEITPDIIEHNTGAACGTWWDLPICEDGTPQGYCIYEIDGNDVTWYFKSNGKDKTYQFRAYAIGENTGCPDEITANVWNYDPKWKVEWLENGKVMGEMTRYSGCDPEMARMSADKSKLRYSWIGAAVTDHMFRAKPVNPDARLAVRVTDRFGNVYIQEL